MRLIAVCLAVAVAGSACIPPEEEEDLTRAFGRATVMGRIQRAGVLRVGTPDVNSPLVRHREKGRLEGLAVDLGRAVADTLGVDAEFRPLDTKEMFDLIDSGDLDIGFPQLPITEKVARRRTVTDPYFVSHQRILAPPDVSEIDDLTGESVCLLGGEHAGIPKDLADPPVVVAPDLLADGIETITPASNSIYLPCVLELGKAEQEGRILAATGLDIDLISLLLVMEAHCPRFGFFCPSEQGGEVPVELTGERMSTAGLGALLEEGSVAWVTYVETVFFRYKRDGGWQASYEKWISPYLGAPPDPPTLTAEEAAALFPKD